MNRGSRILAIALIASLITCVDHRAPTTAPETNANDVTAALVSSAITHTLLASGNNTVNQKIYSTISITPAPNALVTVAVMGTNSSSASPSPTLSGGGMSAWTAVATITFDAVATPHKRLTIYRAMSGSPGSGPLTITFSGSQSNCQWIVSQWDGVDVTGVNGAGAIGQTGSNSADAGNGLTVTLAALADPNNLAYGVFGVNKNALAVTPGGGFTEIAEQPSSESPQGDLEAEWAPNLNTIAATWATLNGGAVGIEIKAGAPSGPGVSASQSTVTVVSPITAGGSSTITVTVNDGDGLPISGVHVTLSAPGSNTITQPANPTVGGVTTGTLSATVAGSYQVTAVAGGVTLGQRPTVVVDPGAAAELVFSAQPGATAPGATITPPVKVRIRDQYGNLVKSTTTIALSIATNPSAGTLSGTAALPAVDGVASFDDLSINKAGTGYTLQASSDGLTDAVSNAFTVAAGSTASSTVTASPASIAAGSETSAITVKVKDASNNPISGATVVLSATGKGNSVTQPADTTDATGMATGTFSSTVAGAKTISATANGTAITQKATVTVTPGPVSASQSTVAAVPISIAPGSGMSTITVTAKDASGNVISGATVSLATTGSASLTQPAATTNASGVATGTLSSTVEELATVSATINDIAITQTARVQVRAQTVADPLACTGYPEPRIWLESQAWWDSAGLVIPTSVGHHIHVGMCWPVNPDGSDALVDGVLHLDVRVLLHDQIGRTNYLRFQDAGGSASIKFPLTIGPADVTAWVPVDLDLGLWGTGRRETHVTANIQNNADGKRQFNSTGWQLCVRSCTPTYRTPPWTEARGWYEGHDYQNARFFSLLPVAPVSGLWKFRVQLLQLGPGGVFLDPNFHAGSEGTRVAAAGYYGDVTVDTRLLANGTHRLVLVASDGKSAGVQVVTFVVAN